MLICLACRRQDGESDGLTHSGKDKTMAIDFRRDALPALRAPGDQDYEREVQAASEERSRALAAAVDYVDRANATIAYQARVERAWQVQRGVLRAVRENDAFESDRLTQRSMPITEADIAAIHRVRDAPRPLGSLRTTRAVRENEAGGHAAFGQRQEAPALPAGWPRTVPGKV